MTYKRTYKRASSACCAPGTTYQLYGVALLYRYLPLTAEAARIAAAEQAAAEAKAAEEAAAAVALAAEAELAKASLDRPELKAAAKAELYDSGDEDTCTGGDNAEEAVRFTQLDCLYIHNTTYV